MKPLSILMIVGLLIGCASSTRNPASKGSCIVEQHPENEWFRVTIGGEAPYPSWYTQEQVDRHVVILEEKGKCN